MRSLAAILAYLLAALGGLATGYYATAPRGAAGVEAASALAHELHVPGGELTEMEAAAVFLEAEEARAALAAPAERGL